MVQKQMMVRVPGAVWEVMVSTGLETDRSGAEVARDWMAKGASAEGITLPKVADKKDKKRAKLMKELEALG